MLFRPLFVSALCCAALRYAVLCCAVLCNAALMTCAWNIKVLEHEKKKATTKPGFLQSLRAAMQDEEENGVELPDQAAKPQIAVITASGQNPLLR